MERERERVPFPFPFHGEATPSHLWFVHQKEGAIKLQEVKADSLVAVAKLDEDNLLACRCW